MKPKVDSPKGVKKQLGVGSNSQTINNARFHADEIGQCIDSRLLDMLKSLDLPEKNAASFPESLSLYLTNLGTSLRRARSELKQRNRDQLESVALELSHNALKLGAVNILRSSFDLQNLARCGAFVEAGDIVDQIEVEYLKVQQGLENVV